MKSFAYTTATRLEEVPALLGKEGQGRPIAGGMDLLGELKERLIAPERLVNIKALPDLHRIAPDEKGLTIGAVVTLTEIEEHAQIRRDYPALAQAAASVGTWQIRNVGTVGGNLCQRPRCWYYRDPHTRCLKKGGSHCYAVNGLNRYHAIFGPGPCHIVHPSDLAPALMALGARITIVGPSGGREIGLEEFFRMPEEDVTRENLLQPDEIVTQIFVPRPRPGARSLFLKQRERESFDWALSSVALALTLEGGLCREIRVVLGGVAPIPWRSKEAEGVLRGQLLTEEKWRQAAAAAVRPAQPMSQNAYKVVLTENLLRRAFGQLAPER